MSIVDEGPSKRLKTEALILAGPDEENDYPFKAPIGEEVIPPIKTELHLEPSGIETWWKHSTQNRPEDPDLLKKRMMIIHDKNLRLQFSVPTTLQKEEEAAKLLEMIIRPARIMHLDWVELYFAEEADDLGPFSLRNELEALNSILSSINSISTSEYATKEALDVLRETVISKIVILGENQLENMKSAPDDDARVVAANDLLVSAKTSGMVTKLDVACFQEAGRGLVASEDIKIGDVALEVPMKLVISDDFIKSDLPSFLNDNLGLSPGDKRLMWTMREMRSPRAELAEFFELLPKEHKSGVWFGQTANWLLHHTPLEDELKSQRLYTRFRFDSVIEPILKENHAMFHPWSFEKFMSAWEVWNSHSVGVVFPDDKVIRPCLVPIAGFFNHSQCPHVLYGKYAYSAGSIQFIASRPCKKGEQCYLSYGNLSGAEFITFYGFLPKGPNYHDVVRFVYSSDDSECIWPPKDKSHWNMQMARGMWPYSKRSGLTKGLVDHVRTVMKSESWSGSSPPDREVYGRLWDIFMPLIQRLEETSQSKLCPWDVRLAFDYIELYWEVLNAVMSDCHRGFLPELYSEVLIAVMDEC